MKKIVLSIFVATLLVGCLSIDYVIPPGSTTVPVMVSTNMMDMNNIKVRYQGVNSCENYPGNLMAMVNSVTGGIEGGNPVKIEIAVDELQVISVMGAIPLDVGMFDILFESQREEVARDYSASLRELYFAFVPKKANKYSIQFDFTGTDIALVAIEIKSNGEKVILESLPLPDNCKNIPIHNI